ncbi:unnamed protein product [Acidithrix sp. C25]|nr:unnamed protein product [Acidithrix sp. C25]
MLATIHKEKNPPFVFNCEKTKGSADDGINCSKSTMKTKAPYQGEKQPLWAQVNRNREINSGQL